MTVAKKPLEGMQVLSLAINLPGPVAAARLQELGAAVVKVEPPEGDPLHHARPEWFRRLTQGQTIVTLNLKNDADRRRLNPLLAQADLLVTATRPAALERLGLAWGALQVAYPRLCQVAIVGYPGHANHVPGHDLNYQARVGLVAPPALPRTCLADLAGAQEVVVAALALLLARERGGGSRYQQVSLAQAAAVFAEPLRHGLTTPGGPLGGGLPGYNLYQTRQGWLALAALEPHFLSKLAKELGLASPGREELQRAFLTRTAAEWEAWAVGLDLPIVAVQENPDAPS
jgi:crotonobetainyl-CoA:carnitine CoA-transferase CaiB-like acyl-CoA transferase